MDCCSQCDNGQIKTVTVDVFDTLLLRTVAYEPLRFLQQAELACAVLERYGFSLQPYEFFSLRKEAIKALAYAKRVTGGGTELTLAETFNSIIESLIRRQPQSLSEVEREDLLTELMWAELEYEKTVLYPNEHLVAKLRRWQSAGVRLYFLSDMYLSGSQITHLLSHFNLVDLFSGGITSADLTDGKHSGRAFERLRDGEVFPDINPAQHLHLGDDPHSDIAMATQTGFRAERVRDVVNACIKPLFLWTGRQTVKRQRQRYARQLRRQWRQSIPQTEPLGRIGALLGLGVLRHLCFVKRVADYTNITPTFCSGEASQLVEYYQKLGGSAVTLPTLNRQLVLRALLYQLINTKRQIFRTTLLSLAVANMTHPTLAQLLRFIGLSEQDIALAHSIFSYEQHVFRPSHPTTLHDLLQWLKENPDHQTTLRQADARLQPMCQDAGLFQQKQICIVDVGWTGTIQIFLEHYLRGHDWDGQMFGIYMGSFTREYVETLISEDAFYGVLFDGAHNMRMHMLLVRCLWEYLLHQDIELDARAIKLRAGSHAAFQFFLEQTHCSSETLFEALWPRMRRFFVHPKRSELKLFMDLNVDAGLVYPVTVPLFATHRSALSLWFDACVRPRKFLREMRYQQWIQGYLHWYRMTPLAYLRFVVIYGLVCWRRLRWWWQW